MDWTKEAIEARKQYIGGSDAAAILGRSRYKTAYQVWAIKTGQIIPPDISDKTAVKLGNKLEQTVAEFFEEATGKRLIRSNRTLFHPRYKFLGANIDRIVVGEDAGLECKTTGQYSESEWRGSEIPEEYLIQCYHYMAVTGKKTWYIAVLIGNRNFLWKEITRNQDIIDKIIKKEVDFWNTFVVPKVQPLQLITSEDDGAIRALYPQATEDSVIEFDDKVGRICESLDSMKADFRILGKEIEEQENTLKALLQDKEIGLTKKYKITWKNQVERRFDSFRFKEDHPDLYAKYSPEVNKRILRLTVIKAPKEAK